MYILLVLSLTITALPLSVCPAGADVLWFDDMEIHFPGWASAPDTDAYGVLDFGNGFQNYVPAAQAKIVRIDRWYYLQSLEFFYGYGRYWDDINAVELWDLLHPGDLFLSVNAPDHWNYIVKLIDDQAVPIGAGNADDGTDYPRYAGEYDLYSVGTSRPIGNLSAATISYLTVTDEAGRQGHPYAVDSGDLSAIPAAGKVYFDGLRKPRHGNGAEGHLVSSLFTFNSTDPASPGLLLGRSLWECHVTFGWTQRCASDIMIGTTAVPGVEVPEPATLLLLGVGLVGIMACRHRRP